MPGWGRYLVVGISGVTCGGKSSLAKRLQSAHPSSILIQQDDYFFPEGHPRHVPAPGMPHHCNWDCTGALDMERLLQDVRQVLPGENTGGTERAETVGRETCPAKELRKCVEESDPSSKLSEDSEATRESSGGLQRGRGEVNFESLQKDTTQSPIEPSPPSLTSPASSPPLKPRLLILEGFLIHADSRLRDLCDVLWCITLSRDACWERRKTRVYEPPDVPGYFDACVWPEYEAALERLKLEDLEGRAVHVDGEAPLEDLYARLEKDVTEAAKRVMDSEK